MLSLTRILGGEVGQLPSTYLGMPLGANSKSNEVWSGVIERCERRLSRWKAQYLSKGGRLVLINSVLDALPTYLMSVFPLSAQMEGRIDALRRNFLWNGEKESKGYNLVKWKTVLLLKKQGGLGIKNLRKQNRSLMMKWLWRFTREEQALWARVIQAKYETLSNWTTKEVTAAYGVSLWRSIRLVWVSFLGNTSFNVNNGRKVLFWDDDWLGNGCLKQLFPDIYLLNQQQQATIQEVWNNNGWNLTFRRMMNDWEIDRLAEFYGTIQHFGGLKVGEDILR